MKKATEAQAYEWDFFGACAPNEDGTGVRVTYETFTLGLFRWLPRSSGKGLKKGKVVKRISGQSRVPKSAYRQARQQVEQWNAEKYDPQTDGA